MKKIFPQALTALVVAAWMCGARQGLAVDLHMVIEPVFGGRSLQFDTLTNTTTRGQTISVTRLDFLLSNFALRRADGSWIEQTNWFTYFRAREGKNSGRLDNVPAGDYSAIRFLVGLKPEINHSKPERYPAGHALNPDVNGLHWGWMGGYVFMALEGNWLKPDGGQSGFSYHLATDKELMTVELPISLNMTSDCEVRLYLDVDQIFGKTNCVNIDADSSSTHSRSGDRLADALRGNIEQAFSIKSVTEVHPTIAKKIVVNPIEIAPDATPYRLTISAFFPRPTLPQDNPLTEEGVALGRKLFFDKQLSINNAQSCSSCHNPSQGFSETKQVSLGAEGKSGTRNAMPLMNLAWKSSFFWDGRTATLREQVLQPIQNPIEMHDSLANICKRLNADVTYPSLFNKAFGTNIATADRVARALEQFLLTQVSFNSKFDHVIAGEAKFTEQEQRGFELFHTEYDPRRGQHGADCFHCHGGPLFQSQSFANNGLDAKLNDTGRYKVTGRNGDEGKFAVPSLRNVEVTGPYMHDGRFQTLEEAVEHYLTGMKRSSTLDPNLAKHPDGGLPLNSDDKKALVAFLKTLTDEKFRPQPENTLAQAR